ncbi:MAG: arsenosugar biosynthesis radical SAM protein ArsS [Peptoniphilus sp.]|nr:arsenosugar biosynthesis radical SAM (seleno)protein ArsS [Peptoniphilus sp.]MDD7363526.1 arsenosugar biosynthesis radical SAM protein ArsS [Bacillota bacterium]MDY6044771.1 arsenosugar biosynthesis radical SAM protein ArsS [Peptoniphilus sp.]
MQFKDRIDDAYRSTGDIDVFQVNITGNCNLRCAHCHVMKDSDHLEMSEDVMDKCIEALKKHHFHTLDITGGEPTTHPLLVEFIERASEYVDEIILRTNAVDFAGRDDFMKLIDDRNIHIVVSLPCYTEENVDDQRGTGTYHRVIPNLRKLNELGYGDSKDLSLVYNPLGAFLPGPQEGLEHDYKEHLGDKDVAFSELYTITNMPIGFFKDKLKEEGLEEEYMTLLEDNFNEDTVENLMCRYQISVDPRGYIYDCDFHQAEGVPASSYKTIDDVIEADDLKRDIVWRDYCYGCTAGAGSSCGGALADE